MEHMMVPTRRMSARLLAVMLLVLAMMAMGDWQPAGARQASGASTIVLQDGSRHVLQTPEGMTISLYATGLGNPRLMALGPNGVVFVGTWGAGTVYALMPTAGRTHTARVVPLLTGLDTPQSVWYRDGKLYVAEQSRVIVMRYDAAHVRVTDQRVLISGLPTGGRHITRTVITAPDGTIYVAIGSSCNVCVEQDQRRAAIMRYRPDGSGGQVFARGLRNAVGLAWQPGTGLLWATDNGRDLLGDNVPPDEVVRPSQGSDYGWPSCWGSHQPDPTVPPLPGRCARALPPLVALPAHSAPLGLAFSTGTLLPSAYRGGLFVAYHGSWNRTQPAGYKLVYIPVQGRVAGAPRDMVTGWLAIPGKYSAWGRPVGVVIAADGSLLISDDQAGVIYRLAPAGR